jgi:hypothetical protein
MDTDFDPWSELRRTTGLWFDPGGTLHGWGTSDGTVRLAPDVVVAAELESTQAHPDTNVLKYWPWLEERPTTRLLLVHIFGRWSTARTGNRSRLAVWLGSRLEAELSGRFMYRRIDMGYPSFREQMESLRTTLAALGHALPD